MICQKCQENNATVHFTQIINNKKIEMYICDKCAKQNGDLSYGTIAFPFNINNLFSGLIALSNLESQISSKPNELICDKCGLSYEEFRKIGKFGCANCYKVFGERLNPLLKKLQGSTGHRGKVPQRALKSIEATKEIERLKGILNSAVKDEEYEKAAEIRDIIKKLELGNVQSDINQ